MTIEGTLFKVGTPLKNGMVITEEAIDKYLSNIETSGMDYMLGQLDYPEDQFQLVPLCKVAVKTDIKDIWKDSEGNLMARVNVLDTFDGKVLSEIANRIGKDLKLSPAGTIDSDGNFELTSVNVVYE